MSRPKSTSAASERDAVPAKFIRNLPRFIIGLAHVATRRLMDECRAAGLHALRAPELQLLLHVGPADVRITDLARRAGITQQTAGQLLSQLERHGLLQRTSDPTDKRVRKVLPTPAGRRLLARATRAARRFDQECAAVLGSAAMSEFRTSCTRLYNGLIAVDVDPPALEASSAFLLPVTLAGLAGYCEREIMELGKAHGYPELKLSFGQVFMHVSPHGSLINDLARLNDVSKQAISQIVRELESLHYIERRGHPGDRRSTMIFLSKEGVTFIRDAIDNVAVVEAHFDRALGKPRQARLAAMIERLFDQLRHTAQPTGRQRPDPTAEAALHEWLAQLYRLHGDSTQPRLFNRTVSTAKLSAQALRILEDLEIRIPS